MTDVLRVVLLVAAYLLIGIPVGIIVVRAIERDVDPNATPPVSAFTAMEEEGNVFLAGFLAIVWPIAVTVGAVVFVAWRAIRAAARVIDNIEGTAEGRKPPN